MIASERIRRLNSASLQAGNYVLYWMQSAQRVAQNEALQVAIDQANTLRLPVVVCFGLAVRYPAANWRHYHFLLEGLQKVALKLRERGIALVVRLGEPPDIVADLSQRAALVVVDRGYLRLLVAWYQQAAQRVPCTLLQVESNVVVPVAIASLKEEYAARTIRPRLERHLDKFLTPLPEAWPMVAAPSDLPGLALDDLATIETLLAVDRSVPPSPTFRGGEDAAQQRLVELLEHKLERYVTARNDPAQDGLSHLSPYLHLGQISPRDIALQAQQRGGPGAAALIEELVVRRELAINYCTYNPHYGVFAGLPDWSKRSLAEHASDPRPYWYTREALEAATTHDPYWNAAQREMVLTGKMHGYMRMYWGKKVFEWSDTPAEAFATLVHLNDKYELDGRDPNGYAGIAWCFGKHDRPWQTRPVFGAVRYMNAAGLARKFDIAAYVARIAALEHRLASEK